MSKSVVSLLWLMAFIVLGGCDGFFPVQQKIGPPKDHTVNEHGAMHKRGLEHPFRVSSGCSDSKCHHSDLRGGLAEVEGRVTVAPSCYQCHDEKWEDHELAGFDTLPQAIPSLLNTHAQ